MQFIVGYLKILALIETMIVIAVKGNNCEYPECPVSGTHTMCKYPAKLDTSAPKCSGKGATAGLTAEDKRVILDKHNELRRKIANGEQKGFSKAANMMQLAWNPELEMIAQRFINSCGVDGDHDKCRNLKDNTPVGQNSANSVMTEGDTKATVLEKMVESWYDPLEKLTDNTVVDEYTRPEDVSIKDFTQLIWAESNRLGCGYRVESKVGNSQAVAVACNYATEGNVKGDPVYVKGEPCSKCPKGSKCSKTYPGLCAKEVKESINKEPNKKEEKKKDEIKQPSDCDVTFANIILTVCCITIILRVT
ncbi:scoloptoxin SSD43-like [Macrosteles quadrilineatus]|uniref:scoloptoxin SSD43-like n=1 Tax=Macrosteles quadrilineatus TaxID=74068 RepID=UPI0023E2D63D|nr:scoloptoxin SSD43-like [Macrosteles quadrilineatus]